MAGNFCTKCGTATQPGMKFCTVCGTPMPAPIPVPVPVIEEPVVAVEAAPAVEPAPVYAPPPPAPPPAPVYAPPAPPVYQPPPAPAPSIPSQPAVTAPKATAPPQAVKPGTGAFLAYLFLTGIPGVGLLAAILLSLGKKPGVLKNLARAMIFYNILITALVIFLAYWAFFFFGSLLDGGFVMEGFMIDFFKLFIK